MNIPIEYRIKYEGESGTLDFKREMYKRDAKHDLIKDIMATANYISTDPYRYIVIGVEEEKGEKQYLGIDKKDFGDVANYQQLIDQHIEPSIKFEVDYVEVEGKTIAVLEIGPCINPPYILKKDTKISRQGYIYIRTNSATRLATRQELDLMYQNKQKVTGKDIRVGINEELGTVIEFDAISEEEEKYMPSVERTRVIKNELRRRRSPFYSAVERALIGPSAFTLVEKPLSARSEEELTEMLQKVEEQYKEKDQYYLFEQIGNRINIHVFNEGSEPLKDVEIRLIFPLLEGLYIADEVYPDPENNYQMISNYSKRFYFDVEETRKGYIVSENIELIRHKLPTKVFNEDIRIAFSSELVGEAIPVEYEIYAENYPDKISGEIMIRVVGKAN